MCNWWIMLGCAMKAAIYKFFSSFLLGDRLTTEIDDYYYRLLLLLFKPQLCVSVNRYVIFDIIRLKVLFKYCSCLISVWLIQLY